MSPCAINPRTCHVSLARHSVVGVLSSHAACLPRPPRPPRPRRPPRPPCAAGESELAPAEVDSSAGPATACGPSSTAHAGCCTGFGGNECASLAMCVSWNSRIRLRSRRLGKSCLDSSTSPVSGSVS